MVYYMGLRLVLGLRWDWAYYNWVRDYILKGFQDWALVYEYRFLIYRAFLFRGFGML